jgi:DNA-binding PadR family transcriptional regulator
VQFLILRIIYDKPTYGYKLMEALDGMGSGCHKLETGSVYTLLRRMERAGLLESEWERAETSGPSRRRIYKVTKRGAEALRSGLESIVKRKALMDDLARFYRKEFGKIRGGE